METSGSIQDKNIPLGGIQDKNIPLGAIDSDQDASADAANAIATGGDSAPEEPTEDSKDTPSQQ